MWCTRWYWWSERNGKEDMKCFLGCLLKFWRKMQTRKNTNAFGRESRHCKCRQTQRRTPRFVHMWCWFAVKENWKVSLSFATKANTHTQTWAFFRETEAKKKRWNSWAFVQFMRVFCHQLENSPDVGMELSDADATADCLLTASSQ